MPIFLHLKVMDDRWGDLSAFDYKALGLSPPEKTFTREQRQRMLASSQGGGQQLAVVSSNNTWVLFIS